MFFSQYFSFPPLESFHHFSTRIHPSITHKVKYFSPISSIFPC
jgi:hypothetical protein